MNDLAGTFRLVRLALRRDRIRLAIWILAIAIFTAAGASGVSEIYGDPESRQDLAATMDTPAGLAMTGPREYFADYHTGALLGHQFLGFSVVLVGIMSILLVVRHTRTEEESGRAELVRSSVVGRHAHLTSALIVALIANVLVGLAMAVSLGPLGLEGVDWQGSLLYGAAHVACGMFFAAVAAVTAQIFENPRAAAGLGFATIGAAYVIRAVGDIGEGNLSWFSPIGWAQATLVYLENNWWPLLLSLVVSAVLIAVGYALSVRRDVGAGLRQPRAGTAHASGFLVRPLGFAVRLHRGLFYGFAVGMILLGMSYGSILGDVADLLGGVELIEDALTEIGGVTIVESFASLIMVIMSVIGSIYLVMAAFRARSEEGAGRAEPVLATALSQPRWLGSHVVVTLVGGAAIMALAGLGLGLAGASSTGDNSMVGEMFLASLAYIPAMWVAAGVAVALYGVAPRLATLAWIVPLFGFVVSYMGELLQFPNWLVNLSPFGHVPRVPAQDMNWTPIWVLILVAAALIVVGLVGFRRRDLHSTA